MRWWRLRCGSDLLAPSLGSYFFSFFFVFILSPSPALASASCSVWAGTVGSKGNAIGQFSQPWGVAFDDGLVFVADEDNSRIQAFDLAGIFQYLWPTPAHFGCASAGGNVFVGDAGGGVVNVYRLNGTFVRSIGTQGTGPGQLNRP